MKRPTLIISIIAVVILGIGIFYIFSRDTTDSTINNLDSLIANGETVQRPIYELLNQNKKIACAFNRDNDPEMKGNIYIDNNELRGDFLITQGSENNSFESHLIRSNGWSYIWTEQNVAGSKVKIDDENTDQSEIIPENLTYTCADWTVDNSKFNPPSDIDFTDLTEEVKAVRERINSLERIDCRDCETLQEENSQKQCKELLKCSI